jgi:hypothetical protein
MVMMMCLLALMNNDTCLVLIRRFRPFSSAMKRFFNANGIIGAADDFLTIGCVDWLATEMRIYLWAGPKAG